MFIFEWDMDKMLDSLWDSRSKVIEAWSSRRTGMMSLSDDKAFLKLRYFLLECEKINSKSNFFSGKHLVLKAGVSANYAIDGLAKITGKEGIEGFTLKSDSLLHVEGLDEVK